MANSGYIKLYRKLLDNPVVCKDADHLAIWCYLLLSATHTEKTVMFNGKKITLKKGQLITGRRAIAELLVNNQNKVQRVLKCFADEQLIEQQTTNRNRLITVKNWSKYQAREQQNVETMNNERTTSEQQSEHKQEYLKNDKNDKKVKEKYIGEHEGEISDLEKAILDFKKYRTKIKRPLTDRAETLLRNNLDKFATTDSEKTEIINQSIMNGWTGIFPLKEQTTEPGREIKKSEGTL